MNDVRIPVTVWRLILSLTLILILHLATTPQQYPGLEDLNDKVSHILAFLVLSLLADYSFPMVDFGRSKVFGLLAYGLSIEITQYFLPYRTFSLLDLAADGVGIVLYRLSLPALKHVPWLRARWKSP